MYLLICSVGIVAAISSRAFLLFAFILSVTGGVMSHLCSATTASAYQEHQERALRRADRMFAGLMLFQWFACLTLAAWLPAAAYSLPARLSHFLLSVPLGPAPLAVAVGIGGLLTFVPVALLLCRKGAAGARHITACAQMLMSFLLIYLTGGRVETHFHVFGSLAFLAFYRDWRILATATVTATLCHWAGGIWLPQFLYGVPAVPAWLWLEHTGWVVFEDVFLLMACRWGQQDMRAYRERMLAEERFRILFEHSTHAHVIFDETGILDCNQAAVRMMRCGDRAAADRQASRRAFPADAAGRLPLRGKGRGDGAPGARAGPS